MDIIDEIWCSPQLDFKGRSNLIPKQKFLKFLFDNKLILTIDSSKVNEFLANTLLSPWGSNVQKLRSKKLLNPPYDSPSCLDDMQSISKSFYEQVFEKVLLQIAAKNCLGYLKASKYQS